MHHEKSRLADFEFEQNKVTLAFEVSGEKKSPPDMNRGRKLAPVITYAVVTPLRKAASYEPRIAIFRDLG